MEWVIAGAALLIIAAFIFVTTRSARAPRPQPRAGRRDDGTGAAIATGVIVGGVAATSADDEHVDKGSDGGGGSDPGASIGGSWSGGDAGGSDWGGGDGGGGGGGDGGI